MANTVKLKRSAVAGKVPVTGDLQLGELALNTNDGVLFFKRDVSGSESIVKVGTTTNLLSYIRVTSNTTAVSRQSYIADTSAGSFTLTLPTSPASGDWVTVVDGSSFLTNPLTIGRNFATIEGITDDVSLNISGVSVTFVFDGTTWELFTQVGAQGGTEVTLGGVQTLSNKTLSLTNNTITGTVAQFNAAVTDGDFITGSSTNTLTNKTISLDSNTITGTLAQFNTAITDANIAAETHKYHEFTLNAYYYDSYEQEKFFRLFTQNATYDTARYSAVTNVEYWDGTSWVSWVGGDTIVKNLLDGRDDTYADIDHTHRKFRFTINKNSGWPTKALIATYFSWFGNGWTPYTLTIEDTADSSTWTTKETLTFGNGTTTTANYGWHAFYSGNLHNGRTLNRITYDITDWTDSGGYLTKRLYALSIFSNYSGASDSIGVPVTWNYDKIVNFAGQPTVGGVQIPTLTSANTLTNKTLTSPTINAGALSGTFSGNHTLSGDVNITGALTLPNRPAFRVVGNGGAISATTTITSSHWTLDYQQGSALNTTTGIFTAPIAGLYQVNLVIRTNSNTSGTITQAIVRKTAVSGGAVTAQIMVEFGTNTSMNHTGGSTIVKMAVGDTLKVDVTVGTISFDGNDNWSVAYIG